MTWRLDMTCQVTFLQVSEGGSPGSLPFATLDVWNLSDKLLCDCSFDIFVIFVHDCKRGCSNIPPNPILKGPFRKPTFVKLKETTNG